jgi:hypothetical protein
LDAMRRLLSSLRLFDAAALTEPPFILYSDFLLLSFVGPDIPFFYLQVYSLQGGFVREVRT